MIQNNKRFKITITRHVKGFTLIELMIAVAIIGILASVAYPSYSEFVIDSNRSEAPQELIRLANLQEQLFVDTRAYTNNLSVLVGGADANFTTDSGNYIISSQVIGNTFTLFATAQGTQAARDVDCAVMTLTDTGAKGPIGFDCWEE
jgi:type IV pilus assembly protein PilE